MQVAIYSHPWQEGGTLWNVLCGAYVAIFSVYWLVNLVHLAAVDLRSLAQVQHFYNHKLGLSERQLQTVTWPEVVHRIVEVGPKPCTVIETCDGFYRLVCSYGYS